MKDRAIVAAAFGTSTTARETYSFVDEKLRHRFPEEDIFWAYSSETIRKKLEDENICWQGPQQMVEELNQYGYKRIVFQSFHIVAGIEFEKAVLEARKAHPNVSVGMPLLSSEIDCYRVVDAICTSMPDPERCITVFAGHGTIHSGAGSMYMQFEECLKSKHHKNVFVCMVEGMPSWETTLENIKNSPIKKIKFIPLMFVAGDHMMNDVLGEDYGSWKTRLEGYEIDGSEKGLGYNEKILEIYFDHLVKAMEKT